MEGIETVREQVAVAVETASVLPQNDSLKTNTLPDHERVGQDGRATRRDYIRYSDGGCDNCGESPITEFVVYNGNTVLYRQCFDAEDDS